MLVYGFIVAEAEAPRDLRALETCRLINQELAAVVLDSIEAITFTISDLYWNLPILPVRDSLLRQVFSRPDRKRIKTIKFNGDDKNIVNWMPEKAIDTLALHGIQPQTVVLHHGFSPSMTLADVYALLNAIDNLTMIQSQIQAIRVCNMPAALVLPLGYRLLDLRYVPNMDIEKMCDNLLFAFARSGGICINLTVATLEADGKLGRGVNVLLTALSR